MAGELKTALVIGYTGATGREVVKALVETQRFEKVVLVGRRQVEFKDEPRIEELEQRVVDFDNLEKHKEAFSGFDVVFCCLGTTRKDAGSAEAFRRIDFDYVHESARLCKDGGTTHFHYVSSHGSNKNSSFLYMRTKGEVEEALAATGFQTLSIYLPKLLLRGDMMKPGQKFFYQLTRCCECCCAQSMHTDCLTLALAMIRNCDETRTQAVEIIRNKQIYQLAE